MPVAGGPAFKLRLRDEELKLHGNSDDVSRSGRQAFGPDLRCIITFVPRPTSLFTRISPSFFLTIFCTVVRPVVIPTRAPCLLNQIVVEIGADVGELIFGTIECREVF